MKAKEYYVQCRDGLMSTDRDVFIEAARVLLYGMMKEMQQVLIARHAQSDSAAISAVKEFEQKYNAVVSLFEKEFGKSPIKRDGFSLFMVMNTPELGRYFPKAKETIEMRELREAVEHLRDKMESESGSSAGCAR